VQSRIIPDRFVEEGDVVAGLGRTEVRLIQSGEIAHESESAGVFWFRDGKIVRWQPFETHDATPEAAGLAAKDRRKPNNRRRDPTPRQLLAMI
jgi:hypothetical protein